MSLEAALDPSRLYAAVGEDVNPARPLFTGDIFDKVEIPGIGTTAAILIGHLCSIRRGGQLKPRMPVATVNKHPSIEADQWRNGFYDRFALPGLPLDGAFHVAQLDLFGLAMTDDLRAATRIACLSHPGINLLQQRLVFYQTRLEVHTRLFQQAFDHTYLETDLLEEWATELGGIYPDPAASFEEWIRQGEPSRQTRLESYQERAPVQREMKSAIRSLSDGQ